jgi:succinate dehydrogenase / fumarate reductase cytochrome b subunit
LATRSHARPISPHLQVYKWGPHMLVSILHRATGTGMSIVGATVLVWWLGAIAAGEGAYATFRHVFVDVAGGAFGYIIGVGLTLSFFQHMASGIRHLVMDTGAGFELKRNKMGALATMLVSVTLTAIFWLYLGIK